MQFHRHGDCYYALSIRGSGHNLLALRFGQADRVRVWAPPRDSAEQLRVNAGDVKSQVLAGVEEANRQAGADVGVADVRYVESDSPSASAYREMARRTALRYLADPDGFDGIEREG